MALRSFGLDHIDGMRDREVQWGAGPPSPAHPYFFEQHPTGQRRSLEISGLTASRAVNVAVTFSDDDSHNHAVLARCYVFCPVTTSFTVHYRLFGLATQHQGCVSIEISLLFHPTASKFRIAVFRLQLRGISLLRSSIRFSRRIGWHGLTAVLRKIPLCFFRRSMYIYSTVTVHELAHIASCSIIVNHNQGRDARHVLDHLVDAYRTRNRIHNIAFAPNCMRDYPMNRLVLRVKCSGRQGEAARNGASGLLFVDMVGRLDHGLTTAWHRLASTWSRRRAAGAQPTRCWRRNDRQRQFGFRLNARRTDAAGAPTIWAQSVVPLPRFLPSERFVAWPIWCADRHDRHRRRRSLEAAPWRMTVWLDLGDTEMA